MFGAPAFYARLGRDAPSSMAMATPLSDLLRQRSLGRTVDVQVEQLVHPAMVHDLFAFLVLLMGYRCAISYRSETENP